MVYNNSQNTDSEIAVNSLLKKKLDILNSSYCKKEFLISDPIEFPLRYNDPLNREIAGLLSALFAYGNVKAIRKFLENLLGELGPDPFLSLKSKDLKISKSLYYRFQKNEDIGLLLKGMGNLVRKHKGDGPIFEKFFAVNVSGSSARVTIKKQSSKIQTDEIQLYQNISKFESTLLDEIYNYQNISGKRYNGLRHLTGDGVFRQSPKKRIMLFLRWMTRSKFPDMGIYKELKPENLIIPLDTHMARIGKILGFTHRNTAIIKTAIEITQGLAGLNSEDPLIYDFALTRPGIIGECKKEQCTDCPLRIFCQATSEG